MTDRELLELAAKAAGIMLAHWNDGGECYSSGPGFILPSNAIWNPLTDDGDALRLAVKLRLDICHNHPADQQPWVLAERQGCEGVFGPVCCVEDEFDEQERQRSTSRAIVRAAAEIGKAMP